MNRPFGDTRQTAADTLSGMNRRLSRMTRTYGNYLKHGAVNAAAELLPEIAALENDIRFETDMYRMTFY